MEKKPRLFTYLIVVLLISLIGTLFVITPAKAQDPLPTLSIAASSSDLCVGAELTLTVHVADVVDLFGYDVSLNFDPDVFEVLSLANNGWLSAVQVYSSINNGTGFIRYAATKVSGTGKSGSGDLVNIRIRVKAPTETIQFSFVTTGSFPTEIVNSAVVSMPYLIGETGNILTHACVVQFPESSIIRCEGSTIPVRVEDVYDLYAYGIYITYDQSVIQVTNVTPDPSFISPDFPIIDFSTPGFISADVTQFDPSEPKDGSGILFNIETQMLVENALTELTITTDSLLSDRNGILIPRTIVNRDIYTYSCDPNAVDVMSFDVVRKKVKAILTWETANELDNVGFNIYRSGFADGRMKKMNKELIPAQAVGSTMGAVYEYINKPLKPWKTYYFWLESVDVNGKTALYGPIKAPKLMR